MRRSAAPSARKFKVPRLETDQNTPSENLTSKNNELTKHSGQVRNTADVLALFNGNKSDKKSSKSSPAVEKVCEKKGEVRTDEVTYNVVWGKKSTKKHKTWEGDGTLIVRDKCATLKDEEGQVLGKLSNTNTEPFVDGYIFSIGGKEVQIIDLVS